MRDIWSSWTVLDSDGGLVGSIEDMLQRTDWTARFGGSHQLSTTAAGGMFWNERTEALECAWAISDISDVRTQKIARLRAAIASGCYRVSSTDLVQRLLHKVMVDSS